MARELIIQLWCDPCQAEDAAVTAIREVELAIGPRGKMKLLAVCERHDKGLRIVEDWYANLAQEDPSAKPRRKPAAGQPALPGVVATADQHSGACAVCVALDVPEPSMSSGTDSLRTHIANKHKIGFKGYEAIAAGKFVVRGAYENGSLDVDFQGEPGEFFACPDPTCSVGWDDRLFKGPARMVTSHVKKEHPQLAQAS